MSAAAIDPAMFIGPAASFAGRHVHLLGIGGVGVSALVPLLQHAGASVSGCDLAANHTCRALAGEGVPVVIGHDPAHVESADVVVHSSAVPREHAELRRARARGCTVLSRAACLAELLRGRPTVAIAGSHGKTTTTALCGHLLTSQGADPLVLVGGTIPGMGTTGARPGADRWCVVEVDESDGGFQHVDPWIAVLTNLDDDHARYYGGVAGMRAAFQGWLQRVPADGLIIAHETVSDELLATCTAPVLRCGIDSGAYRAVDLRCAAEGSSATVLCGDQAIGTLQLPLPGRHNIGNALLALAAARRIQPGASPESLATVRRVARRFAVHGAPAGVRVVEDYAHHPVEIGATIAAAALAGGAVHVILQPHRHSRTADCFQALAGCCVEACSVAVLPIYGAGEEPEPGISARSLAEAMAAGRSDAGVQYTPQGALAVAFIASRAEPGDTVLVLGAGDVTQLVPQVLEALR